MTSTEVYQTLRIALANARNEGLKIVCRDFGDANVRVCAITSVLPRNCHCPLLENAAVVLGISNSEAWAIVWGFDSFADETTKYETEAIKHPDMFKVGRDLASEFLI